MSLTVIEVTKILAGSFESAIVPVCIAAVLIAVANGIFGRKK